jgi:hypothetical protein
MSSDGDRYADIAVQQLGAINGLIYRALFNHLIRVRRGRSDFRGTAARVAQTLRAAARRILSPEGRGRWVDIAIIG